MTTSRKCEESMNGRYGSSNRVIFTFLLEKLTDSIEKADLCRVRMLQIGRFYVSFSRDIQKSNVAQSKTVVKRKYQLSKGHA
jgi:hypothetical protein